MRKTANIIAEQQEMKDSEVSNAEVNAVRSEHGTRQRNRGHENIVKFKWPKGVSGNPSGRPKKDYGRIIAQAALESCPEYIAGRLYDALCKGNAYTFKELCDRAYGKVSDKVELTGKDGGPLEYRDMSEGDIDQRIKQLEVDLGYARDIDEAQVVETAGVTKESDGGKAES